MCSHHEGSIIEKISSSRVSNSVRDCCRRGASGVTKAAPASRRRGPVTALLALEPLAAPRRRLAAAPPGHTYYPNGVDISDKDYYIQIIYIQYIEKMSYRHDIPTVRSTEVSIKRFAAIVGETDVVLFVSAGRRIRRIAVVV